MSLTGICCDRIVSTALVYNIAWRNNNKTWAPTSMHDVLLSGVPPRVGHVVEADHHVLRLPELAHIDRHAQRCVVLVEVADVVGVVAVARVLTLHQSGGGAIMGELGGKLVYRRYGRGKVARKW